jgi:hypothetical protein
MRLIVLSTLMLGCGAPMTPMLHWSSSMPPQSMVTGRVAIPFVVDKRPANRGGGDLANVGNVRSEFGIPNPVRTNGGWTQMPELIDATLRRFVSETLQASGVGVVGPQDPTATSQLAVEITDFFADGYQGPFGSGEYRGRIALTIVILDPASRQPRGRLELAGEGTTRAPRSAECYPVGQGMWRGLAGEQFCNIYLQALTTVQQQILQRLTDPMVRASLLGAPPPAPPPYAPPPQ